MQATITYLLTEQAQRAQMAATGQPVARKQTITVEVPTEDLGLMEVADDGTPYLDLTQEWPRPKPQREWLVSSGSVADLAGKGKDGYLTSNLHFAFLAPEPDILSLLKTGRQKITDDERQRREGEAARLNRQIDSWFASDEIDFYITNEVRAHPRYQEIVAETARRSAAKTAAAVAKAEDAARFFLANPAHRARIDGDGEIHIPNIANPDINVYLRPGTRKGPATDLIRQAAEEAVRRRDADEAAAAAKEQTKTDYIAAWIAEHADDATREQFTDGLLCRSVALSMIADAAFSAAGVPEAAEWDDNYCDNRDCPCGSKDLTCLPRRVYPAWKTMKATLPEGYTVEFSRVRECQREDWDGEGESAGSSIYLAKITIPHGPFQFERTVRLG